MVNGEAGKTHFWNNKVKERIESLTLNGKKYTTIYMSLYGISDLEEISKKIKKFSEELEKTEMIELLGDKESLNAIVTIHSGAGGKEACDWAQMLYRMYVKWSAKEGYEIEEIDSQEGDGVGYKSITFIIKGDYVSEILSGEMGVHRLVRISPFDSSKRRHTSFASVEVLPEVEEQTEVEIRSEDLRIDTYRASGARTDNM